jgi:hypothetical protein
MTAKSKAAPQFKVGDPAIVRDIDLDKIVDSGKILKITATRIVFETNTPYPGQSFLPRFAFKRKGTEWIELKKDHFRLEVPGTNESTARRISKRRLRWRLLEQKI